MEIKIYKDNEKLNEAYHILVEKLDNISKQFQLTYFEIWGIIEAIKVDLIEQNLGEKD
ncbi:hypothetical protein LCGC14_2868260 [marine sediment metagenome]|uniref:Uncharacterized protein n=1 Tax=marine sediment metagenome TaxID=412755 RepID=A0A0F8Y3X7_9ZZZZ